MNKKLSKVAAIALSAAMVTSAFAMSTSSSFAASATTPVITPDAITKVAVFNANGNNTIKLGDIFGFGTGTVASGAATAKAGNDTEDVNLVYNTLADSANNIKKVTYSTDNTNAKITDNGTVKLLNRNVNEFTVTASHVEMPSTKFETVKHNHAENVKANDVTVKATIKVYQDDTVVVTPEADSALSAGEEATSTVTKGFNESATFNILKVNQSADSALAKYTSASGYSLHTSNTNFKFTDASQADTNAKTDTAVGVASATIGRQDPSDVKLGQTVVSAYKNNTAITNGVNANLTVENYYQTGTTGTTDESTEVTNNFGDSTKTIVNTPYGNQRYDVSKADVHVRGSFTVAAGNGINPTVGNIEGGTTVNVTAGKVGSIKDAGTVNVTNTSANGGNTATGDITDATDVTVTGTTTMNDDKTFSTVTTGNISADNVTLKSFADEENRAAEGQVTVGTVTTTGKTSVTTSKDVKTLTVGTITGTQGNYADCPYTASFELLAGKFTTGDLKLIGEVTVNADAELTAGEINTGVYGKHGVAEGVAGYTQCGNESNSELTVNGKLTASKIYVAGKPNEGNALDGQGSIIVPAGSFTIANGAQTTSNLTLYVTGCKKGSELYTAANKAEGLFTTPGVQTVQGTQNENNVWKYVAAKTDYMGFVIDQSDVQLGKGGTTTLTTTAIPDVDMPAGTFIKWTTDKDTVKLSQSADGKTCSVSENGYTAENVNGGNNVVVTANLMKGTGIDDKNAVAYTPFGSDKSSGSVNVTLTPYAAPVLTATVTDLQGKKTVIDPSKNQSIKMTQSTYITVDFAADKPGISEDAIKYISGNKDVAQTGTYTKWNGIAGSYNLYAIGKVGGKAGVYAHGQKLFAIEIVDRPFTSDTTLDLDGTKAPALKVGQKYTFKIVPKDGLKINKFTFNTANDNLVTTHGYKINADGTVTATILASVKTSPCGVYCDINDIKYKIFAAAVTD